MRRGWWKGSTFMVGISRDGGKTWEQESTNFRELDPEKSNLKPGDHIWFLKKKYMIKLTDKGIQAVSIS